MLAWGLDQTLSVVSVAAQHAESAFDIWPVPSVRPLADKALASLEQAHKDLLAVLTQVEKEGRAKFTPICDACAAKKPD